MVMLGASSCIVGRNEEKTKYMAENIAMASMGSKVLGFGSTDVRDIASLQIAVDRCVKVLAVLISCIFALQTTSLYCPSAIQEEEEESANPVTSTNRNIKSIFLCIRIGAMHQWYER